jgi:hypothetical protein
MKALSPGAHPSRTLCNPFNHADAATLPGISEPFPNIFDPASA